MEKMIFDLLQIMLVLLVLRVSYYVLKWSFSSKIRRKSIVGKLWRLIFRRIHYKLDNALRQQDKLIENKQMESGKVIPLKKTK